MRRFIPVHRAVILEGVHAFILPQERRKTCLRDRYLTLREHRTYSRKFAALAEDRRTNSIVMYSLLQALAVMICRSMKWNASIRMERRVLVAAKGDLSVPSGRAPDPRRLGRSGIKCGRQDQAFRQHRHQARQAETAGLSLVDQPAESRRGGTARPAKGPVARMVAVVAKTADYIDQN